MKIKFCGAADTTTGSQHLIEVNGSKILLDCGLFQGSRQKAYEVNCNFPYFNPAEISAVVLSHAHIDHSGNLPNLCKKGFNGNIYATDATRDLCQIMLADSANIQNTDISWLNKHRARDNLPLLEPIYSVADAELAVRNFVSINYLRPINIADGVKLTFFDAGHILGSAQVVLDIDDKEDGKRKRLMFSGDVGRGANEVLRDPENVQDVEYLLMESTYGGREHIAAPGLGKHFAEVINKALDRGGKILIPAFAVERTQQILFVLHQLLLARLIPDIPVYVDSPLAVNATEVYRLHPEAVNTTAHTALIQRDNPFGFENLTLARSKKSSQELNKLTKPAIIISASGMCEAGRILHHLANNIENPKNTIIFVGYNAENTLGRRICDGLPKVPILNGWYNVRAHIEKIDSFSGHADNSELIDYFNKIHQSKKLKNVWLIHGEIGQQQALQKNLNNIFPNVNINCAVSGMEVSL